MKEDSLFIWQPSLTASKHYPVEAKYARIMVGTDMDISISDTNVGYGIGNGFSAVDFSASSGGLELPTGLDVLWLSFAEKKYYCFKQGFSKNIRERLLQLFQKGYQNENEHYDCFVVTLLPGGKIWLSVAGTGCNTLVCDSLQAEEIQMTLKEFKEGYYETFKTLDNVCISGLSDYEGATENLKVNGIPTSLWKKYATHYPYDIRITFEDHAAILKSESTSASDIDADATCYFTTGEYYDLRFYEGIQNRAALKKIIFSWCVGNVCYHGEFFFDEEEVLDAFHEIFGAAAECMQSGALEIKVSKYNNLFKICLSSGTRYYQFEKTKIHVLRTASKEKEEHLVYWNYQEDGIKQYIGE